MHDAAKEKVGTDPGQFRQLYDRYNRPLYTFFANRGFRPEECRELLQETFFRAFRSADRFREEAGPFTWLMSIARNVWLEEERNRARLKRSAEELSLETIQQERGFDSTDDDTGGQLQRLLEQEQGGLILEAMAELPEQMRYCVELRVCQELRYREIAAAMQISIGTVKSQLSEARVRLKTRLATHFSVKL